MQPASSRIRLIRDDEAFPRGIGTKWRKLAPLKSAAAIVAFGGPFSNQLHAVAWFGHVHRILTYGIVRGAAADLHNPTLAFCRRSGMRLVCVAKGEFDHFERSGVAPPESGIVPDAVVLRLGAPHPLAHQALCEFGAELARTVSPLAPMFVGAGSGATAVGLAVGCPQLTVVGAFASRVPGSQAGAAPPNLQFELDAGRFAQLTSDRLGLIEAVLDESGALLDPIYSSRAFQLARQSVQQHSTSTATVLHTGGLQAWCGFERTSWTSRLVIAVDEALHRALSHNDSADVAPNASR